ncbi:PepSY-like domain-containing protein [Porphyromonas sp.]|uniref:PepSY-like domain-containing protein n=1 Tax=Porphyromonas sp. TaxID=1924944 RepID=UPI0026DBC586|nr:PepSY-like domain-containing protein [Porphyromonas sp.]MDO4771380.1 PepSY-like domain-containing protein [Porphyromonas sp.]
MRKMKMMLTSALLLLVTLVGCDKDDKIIAPTDLPNAAQTFISTHFPGKDVVLVKTDDSGYDVVLSDGSKIDFDRNGNWEDVESRTTQVPDGIVPQPILTYVNTTYPDAKILKISRDRRDYEVDLSNGKELKFDAKTFKLIEIDMDRATIIVKDRVVEPSQLPEAAHAFIRTYFPQASILSIEVDNDDRTVSYDVVLSNGAKLDFDSRGEWEEVNTYTFAMPQGIVPAKIVSYVASVYPENFIVKISRDRLDYEVDLNNGVELKFDINTLDLIDVDNDRNGDVTPPVTDDDRLPNAAKEFISTHFPGVSIISVIVDRDDNTLSYDVILANGAELDFDSRGAWKEVKTYTFAVPRAIVPSKIHSFVQRNYPGTIIMKISRDRRDYEVDLNNGVELKFDINTLDLIDVDNDRNGDVTPPVTDDDRLPNAAKEFISTHFPGVSIISVIVDRDDNTLSYDVILANGAELDFDSRGAWKEVKTYTFAVPRAIVPSKIHSFVQRNYPGTIIMKISRDRRDYEVDLNNGVELKFDINTLEIIEIDNDRDNNPPAPPAPGEGVLPNAAKDFLKTHFAGVKIVSVEVDYDDGAMSYEVRLANGADIDFNSSGQWKEVETRTFAVPSAIIPAKIRQHIAATFPNTFVVKISRNRKHYEVDLSNGLELKYDARTYAFLGIDD